MTDKVTPSPNWIGQGSEETVAGKPATDVKALTRANERSSNEEGDTRSQEKLLALII